MSVSREDVRRGFFEDPVRRLRAELYCLWLTFIVHEENNDARKAVTLVVVGVWGIMEVGSAFGVAELPNQFYLLRVVVGVLIGRMWGIEINNFAGVEFTHTDENRREGNGDE